MSLHIITDKFYLVPTSDHSNNYICNEEFGNSKVMTIIPNSYPDQSSAPLTVRMQVCLCVYMYGVLCS